MSFMIFRHYPQIHFYTFFWSQNKWKKFLDTKQILFSKADFYNSTLTELKVTSNPESEGVKERNVSSD